MALPFPLGEGILLLPIAADGNMSLVIKKTIRVIQLDLSYIRLDGGLGGWYMNASLLLPFHQLQILDLYGNELTGCGSLPHLLLWFFVFLYIYIYDHFIFHKLV